MRDNELLDTGEIAGQESPANLGDHQKIQELTVKAGQEAAKDPHAVSGPAGLPGDWRPARALSVIVPTRNEADNIRPLLAGLEAALAGIDAEVLIVDDSDDATPEIARQAATDSALPIRVHARPPGQGSGGLGGAVVVGLSEALGPVCAVMDADLQHPPELLETLLRASRTGADFVVASRYRDGGRAEGLGGWYRQAVSRLATRVAKRVLRPELAGISDPMSGFFLVRRSCLDLPLLHPQGFKLLLELLVHSPRARVVEVSYTFGVRHSGVSKAGAREGLTYLRRLTQLRAAARRAPRKSRLKQVPARGPGSHRRGQRQASSGGAK